MLKTVKIFILFFYLSLFSLQGNDFLKYSYQHHPEKIKHFIDNVLRQGSSGSILELLAKKPTQSYYQYLKSKKINSSVTEKLKALKYQKKVLSTQVLNLIEHKHKIKKYLEIGTPGTYINSLKKELPIEYATILNDSKSFSDIIFGCSLNPFKGFKAYDHFIPLNDYDPITGIEDNSLDLVFCPIGLHHMAKEKIHAFVQSISRVLKPGGIFILREHDVITEDDLAAAHMAHSIYNIIALNLEEKDDLAEYRNFQPLTYWLEILDVHFIDHKKRLYQDGDPTKNILMVFTKKPGTILQEDKRPFTNTFMSAPEWLNVLSAQEYGQFINHTPFYEFPYFDNIKAFWGVFGESWNLARKTRSVTELLMDDYCQMSLFVGIFTTVEYTFKGIISAVLRFFISSNDEARTIGLIIDDPNNNVSKIWPESIILGVEQNVKSIELPRYQKLKEILKRDPHSIKLKSIAGHTMVQITVKEAIDIVKIKIKDHAKILYSWNFSLGSTEQTALLVPVEDLHYYLNAFQDVILHDF